jgi:hypothetical protein
MSALPPKADIRRRNCDVRFVPKAEITRCSKNALFDHLVGSGSSDCGMANPSSWQLKQLRSAEGAKHSFPPQSTDRVFIRSRSCPSNKTLLFLVVALTLHHAMMRSIAWPLSIGSRNLTKQLREKTLKRVRGLQAKSNESPMTQRLNSPHEWLLEKAQHWNTDALYKALSGLAYRLDGQSIRDLFHSEMDSDGFFDKKTRSSADEFDAESWGSHRWHT